MNVQAQHGQKKEFFLLKLYREAVRNVPLLRYSWVLIATIVILTFTAYFQLRNADVFLYAFGVLFLAFLTYLLSRLTIRKDKFTRFLIGLVMVCLVITIAIAVLGFGSFILFEKPDFYKRWFPDRVNAVDSSGIRPQTSHTLDSGSGIQKEELHRYQHKPAQKKDLTTEEENNRSHPNTVLFDTTRSKIRVAILPFEYTSNDQSLSWLSKGIAESLIAAFQNKDGYQLIEGNLRDKILKEIDFQQGTYVDPKTAVKIGKMLGVQEVLIGSCQYSKGQVKLTSRMVDVQTGNIKQSSIVEHSGTDENIFEVQKEFSSKVTGVLNN